MKFTAPSDDLKALFAKLAKFASSRSPLGILKCARLTIEGDTLTAEACDAVSWLKTSLQVTGEVDGVCCANADELSRFVSQCDGETTLYFDKYLFIKSGSDRFKLPVLDPQDWPNPPNVEGEQVDLSLEALQKAFALVKHSYQPDNYKAWTTGFAFCKNGDLVCGAAHRSAITRLDAGLELIVPATAGEWLATVADGGTVTMSSNGRLICLTDGKSTYISSQIADKVMPYRELCAERYGSIGSFTVERDAFLDLVEKASLLRVTRISVMLGDSKVLVYADNDLSTFAGSAPAEFEEFENAKFAINPAYLRDSLKAAPGELLRIHFVMDKHVRVQAEGNDDWFSMIQPLHWTDIQLAAEVA